MAYGGGVYIIKRLAQLVMDAKNDNAGLDLLCDHMTASFVIQLLFYPGVSGRYAHSSYSLKMSSKSARNSFRKMAWSFGDAMTSAYTSGISILAAQIRKLITEMASPVRVSSRSWHRLR